MPRNQFDVFPEVGHIDKIGTAVVDVLLADPILAAFSPIVRASVPLIDPERPKPVTWVTVPEFAAPFQLSKEIEATTRVELNMAFTERRTVLEPTDATDPGPKSVLTWITQVVKVLGQDGARELQVPRYSNVSLVDRLLGFEETVTLFAPPGERGQVEGESPILFWVMLPVIYEWKASLDTLQPSPPGV